MRCRASSVGLCPTWIPTQRAARCGKYGIGAGLGWAGLVLGGCCLSSGCETLVISQSIGRRIECGGCCRCRWRRRGLWEAAAVGRMNGARGCVVAMWEESQVAFLGTRMDDRAEGSGGDFLGWRAARTDEPQHQTARTATARTARTARKQGRTGGDSGARSTSAEWRTGRLAGWEC